MLGEKLWHGDEVVKKNLSHLSKEESVIDEMRILELSETVDAFVGFSAELYREGLGLYEILAVVSSELSFGEYEVSDMTLEKNASALRAALRSVENFDRITFSRMFARRARERGLPFSESDFLPSIKRDETFTYLRNAFADEAYDVFSQDFGSPRVSYSSSFKECVERTARGDVGYCLLPLEERGGVRLPTVEELIFRNELKINSVTPVFGFDGNADLKYALVSRGFTIPDRAEDTDRYLEVRLESGADGNFLGLADCAASYGMTLYRVNTVSYDNEGERREYLSLVFKCTSSDFTGLLTYLNLFLPAHTVVGMYKNLE